MKNKMKVEIWSDVMCPFCYIGKRKFEKALEKSGQVSSSLMLSKCSSGRGGTRTPDFLLVREAL